MLSTPTIWSQRVKTPQFIIIVNERRTIPRQLLFLVRLVGADVDRMRHKQNDIRTRVEKAKEKKGPSGDA